MRKVILWMLCISGLLAFELTLNTGKQDDKSFAILHAHDEEPFTCKSVKTGVNSHFECLIPGKVSHELDKGKFEFFDLDFIKQEKAVKMIIYPKAKARIYDLSQKLYENNELSPSNSSKSTHFTFIFNSKFDHFEQKNGLDFNVDFKHELLPSVGALDLNSNPISLPKSADVNVLLNLKKNYENNLFERVFAEADNAINRYKNSIFMKEFKLYKLRAQIKFYELHPKSVDAESLEKMVLDIKEWLQTYTSDKNYTEMMHLLLKTYIKLENKNEIQYTANVLMKEHPKDFFTLLAQLDFADFIYSNGKKDQAKESYEKVYFTTKDLTLAARAAISLAKFHLLDKNIEEATRFAKIIIQTDDTYFGTELTRSLELARLFYLAAEFDLAAKIYELSFENMSKLNYDNYEPELKNIAITFAASSRRKEARIYVDEYFKNYTNGEFEGIMQKLNDSLFLDFAQGKNEFLHEKYKELYKKYLGNDAALANKALREDMKLYFSEGNFDEILSKKNELARVRIPNELLENAASSKLNILLKNDNCIEAARLFKNFSTYKISDKLNSKKQMLACLVRTSNPHEALNFALQNRGEDEIYYDLIRANLLFEDKDYQNSALLAEQIYSSRIMKSNDEKFRALYLQYISRLKLGEYNEAIKLLKRLEGFETTYQMVEAYDALLDFARENNLQITILTYAPKAIAYQNLKGIQLFSPKLEFIYLETLQKANKNEKALEILKDLLKIKLENSARAQAFYIQSEIYEKLENLSAQRESLKACLEIEGQNSWKNLCADKNALLNP